MGKTNKTFVFFLTLIIALSCVTLLTVKPTNAQTTPTLEWSKTYGPYSAYSIFQTTDGGFAFVGTNATQYTHGYTEYRTVLVKITASGEVEWAKEIGKYNPFLATLSQTSDDGFILSSSNWIVKTDTNGNVIWNNTFSYLAGASGALTSDGSYMIIGTLQPEATYKSDTLLLSYSGNGTLLWKKEFTANVSTFGSSIMDTKDGYYLIGGSRGNAFWCTKTSKNGDIVWDRTYCSQNFSVSPPTVQSIALTTDNGYLLSGSDGRNGWLIKINSDGDEQWHETYELGQLVPSSGIFKTAPEKDNDGYVVFADSILLKTDIAGNLQWSLSYNATVKPSTLRYSNSYITASSGIIANDDSYLVVGGVYNGGVYSMWVAKYAEGISPTVTVSATVPAETGISWPSTTALLIVVAIAVVMIVCLIVFFNKTLLHRNLKK